MTGVESACSACGAAPYVHCECLLDDNPKVAELIALIERYRMLTDKTHEARAKMRFWATGEAAEWEALWKELRQTEREITKLLLDGREDVFADVTKLPKGSYSWYW